jgi:hypothetical protein
MKPGDLVRIHMDWAVEYHDQLALVTELPIYGTARVLIPEIGLREFDKEVLEVVNESR